jgi:hypothetical protein
MARGTDHAVVSSRRPDHRWWLVEPCATTSDIVSSASHIAILRHIGVARRVAHGRHALEMLETMGRDTKLLG